MRSSPPRSPYQRDGGSFGKGRRRRAGSRARIGSTTESAEVFACGPASAAPCFPKDTRALVKIAQGSRCEFGASSRRSWRQHIRKRAMARKVSNAPVATCAARRLPWLGLTLKPGHRRHARGAVDTAGDRLARHGRKKCARTIRSAWSRRARNCPISNTATIPTPACARACDGGGDRVGAVPHLDSSG